ncbi:MAG: toll/interleukin-1 receptor domain-containing protein [Saprospiraceae bacterium]
MNEESIIRKEASDFYIQYLSRSRPGKSIEYFHKIKSRLHDFYSPESKSIFLDELEIKIKEDLRKHRDTAHNGKPDPNCQLEIDTEKLLFYIKQEIGTLPVIAHQKFKSKNARNKVFVSYSHSDKGFLSDMKRHFKPFNSQIDFWDDSKILPGQKWKDEIMKAISETKVAILLVSADFLASDFITTDELPPLLEAAEKEGAVILTVILRPCLFEAFPKINEFQAMNPPSKSVSKMDENEREELFVNLVRQTKRILEGVEETE